MDKQKNEFCLMLNYFLNKTIFQKLLRFKS